MLMRLAVILASVSSSAALTAEQNIDAVSVADAFMAAAHRADLAALRSHLSEDAVFVAARSATFPGSASSRSIRLDTRHSAIPFVGAEEMLTSPGIRKCRPSALHLVGDVKRNTLGLVSPQSAGSDLSKLVQGSLICNRTGGGTQITKVSMLVAEGKITLFRYGE